METSILVVRKILGVASWALASAHRGRRELGPPTRCSQGQRSPGSCRPTRSLPSPRPGRRRRRSTDCERHSSRGDSLLRPAKGPSGPRQLPAHLASGRPRRPPGTPVGREGRQCQEAARPPSLPGPAQGLRSPSHALGRGAARAVLTRGRAATLPVTQLLLKGTRSHVSPGASLPGAGGTGRRVASAGARRGQQVGRTLVHSARREAGAQGTRERRPVPLGLRIDSSGGGGSSGELGEAPRAAGGRG